MIRIPKLVAHASIIGAAICLFAASATAFDLAGAWITNTEACDQVFVTKGGRTSFRKDSDMHGSGFIADGKRLRGRTASCTVTKTKQDGDTINMIADCASDIMLHTVQFSLKVLDDNQVTRIFPGVEGMELTFHRCPTSSHPGKQ